MCSPTQNDKRMFALARVMSPGDSAGAKRNVTSIMGS